MIEEKERAQSPCSDYRTSSEDDAAARYGEERFSQAIAVTLQAPPSERAALFERLANEIAAVTTVSGSGLRPWVCSVHDGTDGSRIFRGGVGASLVIDPDGRLWRARSLEDFQTTYIITPTSCEIDTLTPDYREMREYLPLDSSVPVSSL
jgi:hypothetical protein